MNIPRCVFGDTRLCVTETTADRLKSEEGSLGSCIRGGTAGSRSSSDVLIHLSLLLTVLLPCVFVSSQNTLTSRWEAWGLVTPGWSAFEGEVALSPGSSQCPKDDLVATCQNLCLESRVFGSLLGQTWSSGWGLLHPNHDI